MSTIICCTSLLDTVGNRLEVARERENLSPAEAARRIGVHRATYWRWERDLVDIPAWGLARCAQVFGVTMDDLWPSNWKPHP